MKDTDFGLMEYYFLDIVVHMQVASLFGVVHSCIVVVETEMEEVHNVMDRTVADDVEEVASLAEDMLVELVDRASEDSIQWNFYEQFQDWLVAVPMSLLSSVELYFHGFEPHKQRIVAQ